MVVTAERLRATVASVLEGVGVPARAGETVAGLLVEADLRGVDSHGCHLLSMYVRRITGGQIVPDAPVQVTRDDGSTVALDAGLGLGQVAGLRAVDLAAERSEQHGVAWISVREATHLGALGAYTKRLAERGRIALCVQNGPTVVPPFGGITALFSTNPISYAVPTQEEPTIVYDIATTAVAGNKVLLAQKRGDETIPAGWANDERGVPTTDAAAASVWHLQWFGGHKGYGLGLLVELLGGVLAGSSYGRTEHTSSPVHGRDRVAKGFALVALDPERFIGRDEFRARTDELIRDVRSSERAEGVDRIWLPGEPEHHRQQQRERDGIPLSPALADELDQLARDHGGLPCR